MVARRVSADDVDDVLHDVFLRARRGVSSLRDAERFGPWLFRVVRHAIVDHHRTRGRTVPKPVEQVEIVAEEHERDRRSDLAACIAPFVAALPSPYPEALTLVEL